MVLIRQPEREERTPATRDGRSRGLTPTQGTDSGQRVAAARHLTRVVRSRGRQPVKSLLEWDPRREPSALDPRSGSRHVQPPPDLTPKMDAGKIEGLPQNRAHWVRLRCASEP